MSLTTISFILNFNTLFSAPVKKSVWAWAFPSSPLGALASRVTISPNSPEFCLPPEKSQTYSLTFWRKPCRLRRNGSRSMSTRSPVIQLRTASGETAQVSAELRDLCNTSMNVPGMCSLLFLCFYHRYINALEAASASFASQTNREMLRGEDELKKAFKLQKRHSNSGVFFPVVFVRCAWTTLNHTLNNTCCSLT